MFLNVTAPTEILLCEETLEMILTVTTILPLVACYIFPLPETHCEVYFCVFASSHEQLKRVTTFHWLLVEVDILWIYAIKDSSFPPQANTLWYIKGKIHLNTVTLGRTLDVIEKQILAWTALWKCSKREYWKQTFMFHGTLMAVWNIVIFILNSSIRFLL